jgi:hypothetical protein
MAAEGAVSRGQLAVCFFFSFSELLFTRTGLVSPPSSGAVRARSPSSIETSM